MIYTARKYLSILSLTEDRTYVTYEELIHVLEEQPSNAVYIEQKGILCGLVTSDLIEGSRDEKKRRVPFNKKYDYVHPEEYWRVRQIFRAKANINVLPVVSEDGHLLGNYVRWDDLVGTDYAELLYKDPYVLQFMKENILNAVLVKPAVHGGAHRDKMFLWWRQQLESEGIHLPVIQHWEIKGNLSTYQSFLFVDEDERSGIEVLKRFLYHDKETVGRSFLTITDYLCRMKHLADISFLNELQNQGVFVLAFDFEENNNLFLEALDEKIRKRNEKYGIYSDRLDEKLKESFADELYCEAYKAQEFPLGWPVHTKLGIRYYSDSETEFWHLQKGERLTVNQPEKYDRCIYIYGPCIVAGVYVSDQYTIPSLLQNEMNQAGFFCKVVNRGYPWGGPDLSVDRLQATSFRQSDIVIVPLKQWAGQAENILTLNLTDALEEHDAPSDWFVNSVWHCNHKANQMFAHEIYKALVPVLQQPQKGRDSVEPDRDYIDRIYLRHYFSNFDHTSFGSVGAVVMNCNPFTLGHRFLIEEALKTVDFLIIFVVEADESLFSFQERFAMVCQGTSDLEHIMVVPSGPYILSRNTFPEYFQKIDDEDLRKNTEDDITLFAEKIAPKLGIKYRFVGEERDDKVTNEYNEAMKRILPSYGLQVIELPRKVNGQSVISASLVRQCLSMNRMDELAELIPASTRRIFFLKEIGEYD